MSSPTGECTYLRVRRRRNAQTCAMLRLEGLDNPKKRDRGDGDGIVASLTDLDLSQQQQQQQPRKKPSVAAFWRRVSLDEDEREMGNWKSLSSTSSRGKKRIPCRVVDAILVEEDDIADVSERTGGGEDEETIQNGARRKRRRLTIVDSSSGVEHIFSKDATCSAKKKPTAYRVLDPAERLVDDSLREVMSGEISVAQHVRFISEDPRLASQSRRWLAWRCVEGGGDGGGSNLLHSCALWNDAETTQELLSRGLSGLADAVDTEGRTPYDVARMAGHHSVCQVLEAFGADSSTDYVFDMYCLDRRASIRDGDDDDAIGSGNNARGCSEGLPYGDPGIMLSCELDGGIGYWDERGDLVLEMSNNGVDRGRGTAVDGDSDGGDEDSNDEGWAGNEYPDEEEFVDLHLRDTDSTTDDDDDDDSENEFGFRNRPARILGKPSRFDCDDDPCFDASYGIYGQTDPDYDAVI